MLWSPIDMRQKYIGLIPIMNFFIFFIIIEKCMRITYKEILNMDL